MAQVILTATADSTIYSSSPTNNYGTNANLQVGEDNTTVSVGRSLVKFDVSSLAGKRITTAILRLYDNGFDLTDNTRTLFVNRMVRAWTELGVTWNKYDGTNNWTTAGGMTNAADVELANIASISMPNPPVAGYVNISLTASAIQEWIDGTYANNGFGLSMGTESNDMHQFDSRENTNVPQLVLEYSTSYGIFI